MQNIRHLSAWIPLVAGLSLLLLAAHSGYLAVCLAIIPAALVTTGGARLLLFPDLRAPQLVAIGTALGALLALPLGMVGGSALGLAALALSVCAFIAGGWLQIKRQPVLDEVPAPAPRVGYSAQVSLDDTILGCMAALSPVSKPAALRAAVRESEAAYAFLDERGYIAEPLAFHRKPPPLASPMLGSLRIRGHDCEHLSFASEFEPDAQLPGRERWLGYAENRTSHAVLLRTQQPAPWLVCVHGFGMGKPAQDFQAFRAARLHQRAGLNVALFTLPVHGPRAPAGFNGAKFFGLSIVDFLHAEAQAVWDLRRLIAWIRTQQATQVGVFGISLGAYTSALLSAVEPGLACVIAGVPPTDMIAHREYLASTAERRLAAIAGVDVERDRAVHSVVSPLRLPTLVPHGGRYLFAATGDQFVPIEQVHALWLHWDRPRIEWSRGGHQSALLQRQPRTFIDAAVEASFAK